MGGAVYPPGERGRVGRSGVREQWLLTRRTGQGGAEWGEGAVATHQESGAGWGGVG